MNEAKSKPTSITLVDLISCFDKIHINDVTYDMCLTGADTKAIKMLHKISNKTVIKISGDPEESRSAEVIGAVGQGTGYACKGTSYSVGKGME